MSDRVTIRIPASTSHVGLVRATASALAARLDFTYDRIQDLHIAIDEICSRILANADPPAGRLEVTFEIDGDALRVTAAGDTKSKEISRFLNRWSQMILEAVTDRIEIADRDGIALATFVLERGESA